MEEMQKKTIIWNGDSICAGKKGDDTRELDAWAGRIAAKYEMTYKNYAIGGGTVAENSGMKGSVPRHSVSATFAKMAEEFPDADYIIFEGGSNDADLLKDRLGGIDPADFSGNYDRDTLAGALESIFCRSKQIWQGKKIGFIVAHKMGLTPASRECRRSFFEVAIAVCKKWEIPYLDLWEESGLDPLLPEQYDPEKTPEENIAAGSLYLDGQHLTARGYDRTVELVENFIKTAL